MPYKLRKAPKKDLYWVVAVETGKKYSHLPIPLDKAKAQMRVLESALHGGVLGFVGKYSDMVQDEYRAAQAKNPNLPKLEDVREYLKNSDLEWMVNVLSIYKSWDKYLAKAKGTLEKEIPANLASFLKTRKAFVDNLPKMTHYLENISLLLRTIPKSQYDVVEEKEPSVAENAKKAKEQAAYNTLREVYEYLKGTGMNDAQIKASEPYLAALKAFEVAKKGGRKKRGGMNLKDFDYFYKLVVNMKKLNLIENSSDNPLAYSSINYTHEQAQIWNFLGLYATDWDRKRLHPYLAGLHFLFFEPWNSKQLYDKVKSIIPSLKPFNTIKEDLNDWVGFIWMQIIQQILEGLNPQKGRNDDFELEDEERRKQWRKETREKFPPKEFSPYNGGACKAPYHDYSRGKASVFVLTCIDPRYTFDVAYYLQHKKELHQDYDLFTVAGASVGAKKKEWTKTFFDNLELGIKLHGIKEVWCFDHLDCGMYKATFGLDKDLDPKIHIQCMDKLKKLIKKKHPKLKFREFIVNAQGHVSSV